MKLSTKIILRISAALVLLSVTLCAVFTWQLFKVRDLTVLQVEKLTMERIKALREDGKEEIQNLKKGLMSGRKEYIRSQVQTAMSIINAGYEQSISERTPNRAETKGAAGAEDEERIKKDVAQILKGVRYGLASQDYFWIHDLSLTMIMHPYKHELVGTDVSGLVDPNGKYFMLEMTKKCKKKGEGFVDYYWSKYSADKPKPKISFVKLFKKWGWIVGTGLHLDDIEALADKKKKNLEKKENALEPEFENMLGFTQAEADALLDDIYRDYKIDPATRGEVNDLIKNHYNGYHFVNSGKGALYNSTILMYFLDYFCRHRNIPEFLTDLNLKTDLSWVKRITGANPAVTGEFVDRLAVENKISYDKRFLISKFDISQFFRKEFFPVSFFYLGMLTKKDNFYLELPNLSMRQIFVEYFNELHEIDVSTRYADMMGSFANDANLPALFAGYWDQYVSQLPEAIFAQVNENFYRTTFFELCSRYLSEWFTWNVERSYPKGKSDLEFVGKYNEKFAGIRIVIEFKYYSNQKFKETKTTIDDFELREKDTEQIKGYAEGLKHEYPEAKVFQFVIYCFENLGFRVFEASEKQKRQKRTKM